MSTPKLGLNRHGYWEIRFREKVQGPKGSAWKSCTLSTHTKDEQEAQRMLDGHKAELARMEAEALQSTVGGIVDAYLVSAGKRGVTDTTRLALAQITRHLGSRQPLQLTPAVLDEYQRTRGVAGSTIRRELGALNAALNHAVRHRVIQPNEKPHLDLPAPGAPRDLWLTEDQEQELWDHAIATSRGRARLTRIARFVALGLDTAARKAAIEGLTWDRVDFRAGLIDYREPGRVQTTKRRVPVPVADRLLEILQRAKWEADTDQSGPFVVGAGAIREAFESWTGAAGHPYPWVTPHVLRHTWATLAARRGVSMWEIAGVLGDTVETVTRHYVHHSPGHLRAAVNRPRPAAAPSIFVPNSQVDPTPPPALHPRTQALLDGLIGALPVQP